MKVKRLPVLARPAAAGAMGAVAAAGMQQLPAPDVVFIGGSSGTMDALFSWILGKNPRARIVVNAIVLETVQQSTAAFEKWKIPCEIVQIQASRAKKVGNMHMMMGQNPVYIISGGGQ